MRLLATCLYVLGRTIEGIAMWLDVEAVRKLLVKDRQMWEKRLEESRRQAAYREGKQRMIDFYENRHVESD